MLAVDRQNTTGNLPKVLYDHAGCKAHMGKSPFSNKPQPFLQQGAALPNENGQGHFAFPGEKKNPKPKILFNYR